MKISRFPYRMWYYFRIFQNRLQHLFNLSLRLRNYTSNYIFYLAIKNLPMLLVVFPHFLPFAILATLVIAPLACFIGWIHIKRSGLWKAELDISYEANPYLYKMYPEYWREAFTPLYLELLKGMKRMLEKENMLTNDDKERIESLEQKLKTLIEGGYVGTPRIKMD